MVLWDNLFKSLSNIIGKFEDNFDKTNIICHDSDQKRMQKSFDWLFSLIEAEGDEL